jgi:hypothetical protein
MKLPVEFVEFTTASKLDLTDTTLPDFDVMVINKEPHIAVLLGNAMTRLEEASAKSIELENYTGITLSELQSLPITDLDLVNLDDTQGLLDAVASVKNSLVLLRTEVDNLAGSYRNIRSSQLDTFYTKESMLSKLKTYNSQFRDELSYLYDLVAAVDKASTFKKTTDVQNQLNISEDQVLSLNAMSLAAATMTNSSTTANSQVTYLEEFLRETLILQDSYSCALGIVKVSLDTLLKAFKSLYNTAFKLWIRMIGGSYINEGDNIYLDRSCGKIIVSAKAPPLSECEPVTYMQAPPPQIVNFPGPIQNCPTCGSDGQIINSVTTTTTTKAANPKCSSLYYNASQKALSDKIMAAINAATSFVGYVIITKKSLTADSSGKFITTISAAGYSTTAERSDIVNYYNLSQTYIKQTYNAAGNNELHCYTCTLTQLLALGAASTVVTPFFGGGLDVVPCYYAASNDLSSYLSSMTKVW